jgi:dienelactone hydrolase
MVIVAVSASLQALPLAAQDSAIVDAGLFRVFQGNLEVLRETFRETRTTIEGTATIPIAGLIVRYAEVRGTDGLLRSARLTAQRLAADSLVRTYTLTVDGDSFRLEQADPGREPRRWAKAARADALLPEQSIATFASLIRRAGRRDTTFRVWAPSADSALPLGVTFRGDTAIVTVATLRASAVLGPDGRVASVLIPMQAARAERFAGTDLPPMRGLDRPAADYAAPAGARYTAEDVRVPVRPAAGDTFSLGCTFTKPLGRTARFPAAVTLTGSGLQDRDENLWPLAPDYRPFRQVAERLAAAGIAVLRCDDRGLGASTGRADSATIADFADDAAAQLAWLRARPDVDPRRLAFIGHSEGGMTGPIVAARDSSLAALVIMAGPAKPMRAVLRDQFLWRASSAPDLTPAERDTLRAEAISQADQVADGPSPWMRWARDWDPLPTARRIRTPVLILQGALDRQVTAGQADTLGAALRESGNRDVTVHVFPRLNHLFVVSPTDGSPTEYAALTDVAVPAEVLDTLATWLQRRLAPARRPPR